MNTNHAKIVAAKSEVKVCCGMDDNRPRNEEFKRPGYAGDAEVGSDD